uniref:Transposon Ty3-G Gag-Pol polyprotein n=1 Tax=Cajanus cajan TaxID=3821 RepID=A0A151U7M8_CAJCA|nr:Transposon Ty3-G Gag-Pol polyprotein [Cajanus cajan]
MHTTTSSGHSGRNSTLQRLKAMVYWKGMTKDVKGFIQQCSIFQRCKYETVASLLLQPLPIPEHVWQHITMDVIEGLPSSYEKQVIFVVVDRLSKAAHFMALARPYTVAEVAQSFLDNVFKLHGFYESIIGDRDSIFVSQLWKELLAFQGVQIQLSTAYHPQTDGQSEFVTRCLETYLRCMYADTPLQWSKWLALAERWYNTNYHNTINANPCEIVYGQPPLIYLPYLPGESKVELVDRSLQRREEMLKFFKFHMKRAQDRMK